MKVIEGIFDGKNLKFGIVVSRFNSFFSEKLLDGSLDALKRHNVEENNIDIFKVPGTFEIPFVVKKLIKKNYDAIIALGVVIRGETYHFEVVSNEVSKGIAQLNLMSDVPITFGIVTSETLEQSIDRSGAKAGNKGFEAAMAALEMANLNKILKE
ncbi:MULTISPECIES: 6,7-dimethyl-8-ribityllumazine synthase [unclassified Marinitoga]|uniref:6,7-dimethyl-8-ribityllumazine synthase n=1 Tax=unclassified Marinitoga TaxID=2640159 RepID=UPI0006411ED4|nr:MULTISPECIES: 6,7-dimethyl-8-ribityllumazine synthase [unclassified Marinitoga]KLO24623.1 6,7-dimethyl-8-ribityllumazine synthase [Marinitoga sp. 1155]NUU98847.1 6,7-dimethyl-8-ribityllumazine synthase [Marinitoga sp. 1154]